MLISKALTLVYPKGPSWDPFCFIIYINDLPDIDTSCNFFIYADDTAVFFKHHNPDALQTKINTIIPKLSRWLQSNYLTLNESKTIYQIYNKRKINSNINVKINDVFIERKNTVKYLGIYIDENMKFISHINKITNTVSRNVGMMSRIRHFVETRQLIQLYNAIILLTSIIAALSGEQVMHTIQKNC